MISIATTRMTPTACSATTDGQRQQPQQRGAEQLGVQADRVGVRGVEGVEREVAALEQQDARRRRTPSIAICTRSELLTPSRLPKMMWFRSVWLGVTEISTRPEREQRGEHDADRGVLLDPAGVADHPDQRHGEEPEDQRADRERRADDVGQHHARAARRGRPRHPSATSRSAPASTTAPRRPRPRSRWWPARGP